MLSNQYFALQNYNFFLIYANFFVSLQPQMVKVPTHSALYRQIMSVIFPTICPFCHQAAVDEDGEVCAECKRRLPQTEEIQTRGNITEDKFMKNPHFVRGAAWLHYKDARVRDLVHQMKYKGRPLIGYSLGKELGIQLAQQGFMDGIDVVIPIPLHPKRLRTRGYNQAEYIAAGIGKTTDIPVDTTHIERVINNPQQAKIIDGGRKNNVAQIFAVNHPEEMYRKHILLVDDVVTTGSTLNSCIASMAPFRGCQVSIVTLAKAH